MLRLQWLGLVLVLGMALVLAACGGDDEPSPAPTNTESPPENSTLAPARLDLQRDYGGCARKPAWPRVGRAAGEQVHCGDDLTPPARKTSRWRSRQAELPVCCAGRDRSDEAARLAVGMPQPPKHRSQTINRGLLLTVRGDGLAKRDRSELIVAQQGVLQRGNIGARWQTLRSGSARKLPISLPTHPDSVAA